MRSRVFRNLILVFIVAIAFVQYAFVHSKKDSVAQQQNNTNPQKVTQFIEQQSDLFEASVTTYVYIAQNYFHGKATIDELQQQHLKTRESYKTVEFFIEFYFPQHAKEFFNGPPLLHPDPYPYIKDNSSNYFPGGSEAYMNSRPIDKLDGDHYKDMPRITTPKGLQVLDEILFGENPAAEKEEILKQTQLLQEKYQPVAEWLKLKTYHLDYEMIEALRMELIRVFTLGVTGFDTPGSLNGIAEAKSAFAGMRKFCEVFLDSENSHAVAVDALFKSGENFIGRNLNFEKFDRLTFLMEYINPLYKELMLYHTDKNLPTTATKHIVEQPLNFYSDNLFNADFLNPYYFGLIKREDDSEEIRALGKKLFFDTRISGSGKLSCASCHKPELAFSDGVPKSKASVAGEFVARNSPSLINAVFADRYFYDLRAFDLPDQAEHVIQNHLEFNTDYTEILKKLNDDPVYAEGFKKAFGKTPAITRSNFSSALAAYVMSLVSYNSPFDQYVRGETKKINPKVAKGFNLFMGKANCGTCHYAPHFSGLVPPAFRESESEVIGVLAKPLMMQLDNDLGRYTNDVPDEDKDIYYRSFKTTSVRNVGLTAPYFHNGAYNTLQEVVEFYNHGGAAGLGMTYELPNQTLSADSLMLAKHEQKAIIAFLETLSEKSY